MKVPSVAELKAAAKSAKHDSLGIATEPEALMHLANVSRRAFVDNKELRALRVWSDCVRDVASMPDLDEHMQRWVEEELERLRQSGELVMDFVQERMLPEVRLVSAQPSTERCEELATELKIAWFTTLPPTVAAGEGLGS